MAETHFSLSDGDVGIVPWFAGMDATIAVNLAAPVAVGAAVSDLSATVERFPDADEPAGAMIAAPEATVGTPSAVGNVVSVRLSGLTAGRAYRMTLAYGPAGNKRATGVVVKVAP